MAENYDVSNASYPPEPTLSPEGANISPPSSTQKNAYLGLAIFISFIFLLGGGYYYLQFRFPDYSPGNLYKTFFSPKRDSLTLIAPAPTPTPIPLFPDSGTQGTYFVSQSPHEGLTFKQIILDPLDIKKGQSFSIKATVENETPITKFTGILESDNTKTDITLKNINRVGQKEEWSTTFTLKDSVNYIYTLTLMVEGPNGLSSMKMSPR